MSERRLPRRLHPGAWWLWALALGTAASRTTDPLVLLLLVAVAGFVVAARRSPETVASYGFFLRLGVAVLVVRLVFEALFAPALPGRVLVRLPEVPLPQWMAGVQIGGALTEQALLDATYQGLQLVALLVLVGAANALASPRRLLRALPGALYEAGVAVTVAMSFAPQLVEAASRVRRARRLRGLPDSGPRAWIGVALPVLEDGLERSVDLAAAMDSRGFGRRGAASPGRRRLVGGAVTAGLLAVLVAIYGLLDSGSPAIIGVPLLVVGTVVAAAAVVVGGRSANRSKYRPDPWRAPEWAVVGSGVLAVVGVLLAGRLQPGSLHTTVYPLATPALPWPAALGVLLALAPAWVAPPLAAELDASALPAPRLAVGAGR